MSRPAAVSVRYGAAASNPPPPDQDEICPLCKTNRYFNKDMEFLINPECYHRMCRNCTERTFKDGPAQCPFAGCNKTLRKKGFKTAFFGDLTVEREVDIRRRVATVFNKVEEDFETLDGYNDYLYMVECLTDDLVNGGDAARSKAESQLKEWEAQHKAEIERNKRLARESDEARQRRITAEKDATRQRRLQDLQADADEKASALKLREEMLDTLQSAEIGRATEAMDRIMLKKRGQQKRDAAMDALGSGLSIRGLRDRKAPVVDNKPYDPYDGLDLAPQRVDLAPERLAEYHSEWLHVTRTKQEFTVGGYSPDEYLTRALYEAFSGLGVFVGEEKVDRGVVTADVAAGRMDLDDPF